MKTGWKSESRYDLPIIPCAGGACHARLPGFPPQEAGTMAPGVNKAPPGKRIYLIFMISL